MQCEPINHIANKQSKNLNGSSTMTCEHNNGKQSTMLVDKAVIKGNHNKVSADYWLNKLNDPSFK